jgi:hypothetical protein
MEEKGFLHWQEYCYITHVHVLRAVGQDEEADRYLQRAYERLMMVAGKTQDLILRQSWLQKVPWNREILEEAEKRGMAS